MTLEEYRIKYSMLMEQYQWIEFDLEGLCAALSEEPFHKAIQEIERDSIGGVVREIRKLEDRQNIRVFSQGEYDDLDQIRERRNFWSHQCYTEARDKITGVPQNADMLLCDLQKAQTVLKWLRQIKAAYMRKNRD